MSANQIGYRFTRQNVIRGYIVDFYCPSCKLAIEVDGEYHDDQIEYDELRDSVLNSVFVKTIRFTNERISRELDDVVKEIESTCAERHMRTVTSF